MEANKIIAEFMGLTNHHNDNSMMVRKTPQGNEIVPIDALQYDSSWNWLMPVVRQVLTSIDIDKIDYDEDELKFNVLDCDRSGVHKEVVEFIKFYNNLKN